MLRLVYLTAMRRDVRTERKAALTVAAVPEHAVNPAHLQEMRPVVLTEQSHVLTVAAGQENAVHHIRTHTVVQVVTARQTHGEAVREQRPRLVPAELLPVHVTLHRPVRR